MTHRQSCKRHGNIKPASVKGRGFTTGLEGAEDEARHHDVDIEHVTEQVAQECVIVPGQLVHLSCMWNANCR